MSPRYLARYEYWKDLPGPEARKAASVYEHLLTCNKSHTLRTKPGQEKCTALNDSHASS